MFFGVAQLNGQVISAARDVKTPKQSHRKFKGVRQTRHTEPTEWLPGEQLLQSNSMPSPDNDGCRVGDLASQSIYAAPGNGTRLSRRASGFNSPYAGPHFMVLFMKNALPATTARIHWGAFQTGSHRHLRPI